jgi:hypothetical protein
VIYIKDLDFKLTAIREDNLHLTVKNIWPLLCLFPGYSLRVYGPRVGLFLCAYKRNRTLGSNKRLREAEKEIGDGQYIVKSLCVIKFPFLEDEMWAKRWGNCIAFPVFQWCVNLTNALDNEEMVAAAMAEEDDSEFEPEGEDDEDSVVELTL